MKLFLENQPREETSYHAKQVVIAACWPARTGNKKAINQRRVSSGIEGGMRTGRRLRPSSHASIISDHSCIMWRRCTPYSALL